MNVYSIEDQYNRYLVNAKLDPATIHPDVATELKRAFMAGMGSILNTISKEEDPDIAVQGLSSLNSQIESYFQGEVLKMIKEKPAPNES